MPWSAARRDAPQCQPMSQQEREGVGQEEEEEEA